MKMEDGISLLTAMMIVMMICGGLWLNNMAIAHEAYDQGVEDGWLRGWQTGVFYGNWTGFEAGIEYGFYYGYLYGFNDGYIFGYIDAVYSFQDLP